MSLSVIVPTFNCAGELPRLLACLSPRKGVEFIFVDDGSNDETPDLLDDFAVETDATRVVHQDHGGPGRARQRGLQLAEGRYITFADADDELDLNRILASCFDADRLGLDVVCLDYVEKTPSSPPGFDATPRAELKRTSSRAVLTERAAIWGKIYRLDFLRHNSIGFEAVRSADDVLFSWKVASYRPKTARSASCAYGYFTHPHAQLTRDPQYFLDGVDSLALLLLRAQESDRHGRILALYGWASSTWHILRKLGPGQRYEVAARSLRVFAKRGPALLFRRSSVGA